MLDGPERYTEFRDAEFAKPHNLCPYVKRIALEKILDSLLRMHHEGAVPPEIAGNNATSGSERCNSQAEQ